MHTSNLILEHIGENRHLDNFVLIYQFVTISYNSSRGGYRFSFKGIITLIDTAYRYGNIIDAALFSHM